MATTLNEDKIWRSADWKTTPRREPPYNGIEITVAPSYDDAGKFISAMITVKDCTLDKDGVSSVIKDMTPAGGWMEIPPPDPGSPPDPSKDPAKFTVLGAVKLRFSSNAILLQVRLNYGLEHSRRDELGFIMEFLPSVGPMPNRALTLAPTRDGDRYLNVDAPSTYVKKAWSDSILDIGTKKLIIEFEIPDGGEGGEGSIRANLFWRGDINDRYIVNIGGFDERVVVNHTFKNEMRVEGWLKSQLFNSRLDDDNAFVFGCLDMKSPDLKPRHYEGLMVTFSTGAPANGSAKT